MYRFPGSTFPRLSLCSWASGLMWLAAVSLNAPSQALAQPSAPIDAGQIQRGQALYREHCEVCHGVAMNAGSSGAFDLRSFPAGQKQRFLRSVANGKSGGMPPWRSVLDASQIESLYAYVVANPSR